MAKQEDGKELLVMINLAIVGLGRWGRRHIASAEATGRFRLARAIDVLPDSAADLAARGVAVSSDLNDALGDPKIDAVSLVTPHTLHPAQVAACANAGKHVLTEKPFSLSADAARMAAEACVEAGIVLALGHDNRYYPAIQELKRLIDGGELGQILHIEANISHDYGVARFHRIQREGGHSEPAADAPPGPCWGLDAREGPAGSMVHIGVHRIDSFVQLLGAMTEVYAVQAAPPAETPTITTGSMMVRFASGATGYLGTSQATPLLSRIHVFGTDAWAEARGPSDQKSYEEASLDRVTICRSGDAPETETFETIDSVAANYTAFADAIEDKAPYPIPPAQMVHDAAVLEAVTPSFETGMPVKI